MGQYHYVVNLTKKEFLHPHRLGCGLKLWEQANTEAGVIQALFAATVISNSRGGGDFKEHEWVGRWRGDRIAVVGDYSEKDDLAEEDRADLIYDACADEDGFKDVSDLAAKWLEHEYDFHFTGKKDGWRDRSEGARPAMAPDMVIEIPAEDES